MAATSPVFESGMRGSEKPKRGKLKRFSVQPAENGGFTIEVDHEPASKSKDGPSWLPSVPLVAADLAHLHRLVDEHLGGKKANDAKPQE